MSDINYRAVIFKINNIYPLEGMDNCIGTNIFGNNVILDKETNIGDIGLYFPVESCIGSEFLKANNLYRDSNLNSDKSKKGFFEENGRVRCMKFRGNPSAGFWCPIEFLSFLVNHNDCPDEGESFNDLKGVSICKKYIPKTNRNSHTGLGNGRPKQEKSRVINEKFPQHMDTEHLFKNLHKIKEGNLLIFTWKLHGTSLRVGNVLVRRILNPLERLLKFFGVKVQETEYALLNGSRQVVKDVNNKRQNHWYKKDLWTEVGNQYFKDKLLPNEMIYAEIVGYVPGTESLIQKGFTYACKPGTCEVYIYRITRDNVDLSWEAIKDRCKELGVNHVPDVIQDHYNASFYATIDDDPESLTGLIKMMLEQDCIIDSSHPEEGVVCRIEGLVPQFYKAKAFRFLEYETKALDSGEQDMETVESE